MQVDMPLSLSVKCARLLAGLSQRELSKLAGVSNSMVCRLEAGENPTFETVQNIVKALGYEIVLKKEATADAD